MGRGTNQVGVVCSRFGLSRGLESSFQRLPYGPLLPLHFVRCNCGGPGKPHVFFQYRMGLPQSLRCAMVFAPGGSYLIRFRNVDVPMVLTIAQAAVWLGPVFSFANLVRRQSLRLFVLQGDAWQILRRASQTDGRILSGVRGDHKAHVSSS